MRTVKLGQKVKVTGHSKSGYPMDSRDYWYFNAPVDEYGYALVGKEPGQMQRYVKPEQLSHYTDDTEQWGVGQDFEIQLLGALIGAVHHAFYDIKDLDVVEDPEAVAEYKVGDWVTVTKGERSSEDWFFKEGDTVQVTDVSDDKNVYAESPHIGGNWGLGESNHSEFRHATPAEIKKVQKHEYKEGDWVKFKDRDIERLSFVGNNFEPGQVVQIEKVIRSNVLQLKQSKVNTSYVEPYDVPEYKVGDWVEVITDAGKNRLGGQARGEKAQVQYVNDEGKAFTQPQYQGGIRCTPETVRHCEPPEYNTWDWVEFTEDYFSARVGDKAPVYLIDRQGHAWVRVKPRDGDLHDICIGYVGTRTKPCEAPEYSVGDYVELLNADPYYGLQQGDVFKLEQIFDYHVNTEYHRFDKGHVSSVNLEDLTKEQLIKLLESDE